jgi:predicted CopG family antitoxin
MKQIRIILSDKEYNRLKRVKGKRTWRELLLTITQRKK